MRQEPPLAARPLKIENGIDDLAATNASWCTPPTCGRQKFFEKTPLIVGEARVILCSFHGYGSVRAVLITTESYPLLNNRGIVKQALSDGDYLLGVYHETGEDRERTASDTMSYFFRFHPPTRTWTETNRIASKNGNLQPAAAQITDDYLVAYCRPGGDFEPNPNRFVIRSESRDGGRTWSKGEDTEFRNPNSAVDFLRLRNGHLLLVFNDTNLGDRMPLTAAISTDGDRTYPHRRHIVNVPGDTAAYPVAIQTKDDKIHVVYTSQERTVVNRVVFDESAVLGWRDTSPDER